MAWGPLKGASRAHKQVHKERAVRGKGAHEGHIGLLGKGRRALVGAHKGPHEGSIARLGTSSSQARQGATGATRWPFHSWPMDESRFIRAHEGHKKAPWGL